MIKNFMLQMILSRKEPSSNHISDRKLVYRIFKELLQLKSGRLISHVKNRKRI